MMSGLKTVIQQNKDMWQRFYESKSASEQRLLLVLGISVLLFVVVSSYLSVTNALAAASQKFDKQVELNQWATQQIALIKQSKQSSSGKPSAGSMTQVINSSARRFDITLARLQPQSADYVKVGLEDVNFNQLMRWLSQLQSTYGITASNIDISESDTQGVVRVRRLDLERL